MEASVTPGERVGGGSATDMRRDSDMATVLTGPYGGSDPARAREGRGRRSERRPPP